MRWGHVDAFACLGVDPPVGRAAAGKHKGMRPVGVYDRQFQLRAKRRRGYGFPPLMAVNRRSAGYWLGQIFAAFFKIKRLPA
jgi:hypothetical protein